MMMRKLHPYNFLSFPSNRKGAKTVLQDIPELEIFERYFGARSLKFWYAEMLMDKLILKRARKIGQSDHVPISTKSAILSSLDLYILLMHSEVIADTLVACTSFVSRVVATIDRHRDASVIELSGAESRAVIVKCYWFRFCNQVMQIVKVIESNADILKSWPTFHQMHSVCKSLKAQIEDFLKVAFRTRDWQCSSTISQKRLVHGIQAFARPKLYWLLPNYQLNYSLHLSMTHSSMWELAVQILSDDGSGSVLTWYVTTIKHLTFGIQTNLLTFGFPHTSQLQADPGLNRLTIKSISGCEKNHANKTFETSPVTKS